LLFDFLDLSNEEMLFTLSVEIVRMSNLQWCNFLMVCRNVATKHLHVNNIIIIEEREEKNIKNLQLSHIFVAILCHL
jgi:hypothetical protein